MSEEGGGLPVVRVKFTCANAEEFRRKFEANLVAKGMLARTPQMHEVGRRVLLRLELQDGSLGVDEEALVQALEWTGGKQAMRLQLLRSHAESVPPQAGPAVTLPAPPVVRPQVMAAPSQALAAGTDIPAVRDVPRPPARARTDTETTRSMSVDELLNALPPTAKPKLTPARGAPHLNGAAVVNYPPTPSVQLPAPTLPSATVSFTANLPPAVAPLTVSPPPAVAPLVVAPPPAIAPMTPLAPMAAVTSHPPSPFPAAYPVSTPMYGLSVPGYAPPAEELPPIAVPFAKPGRPQQAKVVSFPPAADNDNPWSSASAVELAQSIRAEVQATPEPTAPAKLDQTTAANLATSAMTASNATVAVPELASQVKQAKRRGPGTAIAATLLLLVGAGGGGAYVWLTGKRPQQATSPAPSPVTTAPPQQTPPPVATTPAPTAPAPVATTPAPTAPAPVATTPAPTAPAPVATTPAPAAPAPTETAAPAAAQVKLTITSKPPGAKITQNGEPVGQTPMEFTWSAGQPVKLRFSKAGFRPTTRTFTPKANGTLDVDLEPVVAEELKDVY